MLVLDLAVTFSCHLDPIKEWIAWLDRPWECAYFQTDYCLPRPVWSVYCTSSGKPCRQAELCSRNAPRPTMHLVRIDGTVLDGRDCNTERENVYLHQNLWPFLNFKTSTCACHIRPWIRTAYHLSSNNCNADRSAPALATCIRVQWWEHLCTPLSVLLFDASNICTEAVLGLKFHVPLPTWEERKHVRTSWPECWHHKKTNKQEDEYQNVSL